MTSANLTRSALTVTAGVRSYADTTIKGTVQPKGGNTNNFPLSNLAKYAHTLITADTIYEGDRVTDANATLYEVLHKDDYMYLDQDDSRVAELIKLTAMTHKTLTLGDADATTGIYAPSYAESSIYMNLAPKGQASIRSNAGYNVRYDYVGVTSSLVYAGDIIEDDNAVNYKVEHVTPYKTQRSDGFTFQVCALTQMDYVETPGSSGIWHLDSTSVKTDPRNRIKTVIDTYLTAANIKKDNGSTNASATTMFGDVSYPISRLFLTKALDAVAVITREDGTPHYTDKLLGRKPYATTEKGVIDVYAVNKTGVTASNLCEKYENEIKRILTTYDPYANVRDLDTIKPETTDLGYGFLYHTQIGFDYKRSNDDYTAALPTITYGDNQGSTYYFPNATEISFNDPNGGEIKLPSLGRVGEIPQNTFTPVFTITIKCDIDIDAPNYKRWKRPQSSSAITDTLPEQVFREIRIGNKNNSAQAYQNLNWGGGTTIPVRLESIDLTGSVLTLEFSRYSATSGNSSTAKQWYGYT